MRLIALPGIVCAAAVMACTPLGAWVYGDPGFAVSRVRLQEEPASDSAMLVAVTLWNPNDYDISAARFELDLRLDDHTIGRYERDSLVSMSRVDSTTVALAFTPTPGADAKQLASLRRGVRRVVVRGRAVYHTPFGERKAQVEHGGALEVGGAVDSTARESGAEDDPGPNGPCAMGHRPCGRTWGSSGEE